MLFSIVVTVTLCCLQTRHVESWRHSPLQVFICVSVTLCMALQRLNLKRHEHFAALSAGSLAARICNFGSTDCGARNLPCILLASIKCNKWHQEILQDRSSGWCQYHWSELEPSNSGSTSWQPSFLDNLINSPLCNAYCCHCLNHGVNYSLSFC